jgi:presenilin-like A22 family membrane protease
VDLGKALNSKFRTRPIHLAPVVASTMIGILCGYLILTSSFEAIPVTPFSEDSAGSLFNAFYFVILALVGAMFLYLLLKRKKHKLITLVTGFAMTTAIFMLSLIYMWTILSRFDVPYADAVIIFVAIFTTMSADYAIFRMRGKVSSLILLGVGGSLGALLGFSIPTQSTVLILGFLAVYDVYAVYRGPVGKIAQSGLEHFRGLSLSFRDTQIGLGDLTFYSMLSSHMFIYFGIAPCAASVVGILLGCLLSFKMLEKKGMFPGLPFPVFFGLTAGILTTLVSF